MGAVDREEKAQAPARDERGGKDIWDKISLLTVPLVTLVLGLLGAYATYTYNQASLSQQAADAEEGRLQRAAEAKSNLAQRSQEATSAQALAEAQQLQNLFIYVASSEPQKREFGYSMFAALGHKELALRLMQVKEDKAGLRIARALRADPSPVVRALASQSLESLLTPEQQTQMRRSIQRFQGRSYDTVRSTEVGPTAYFYGLRGWTGDGLREVIRRYCDRPDANVRSLCGPDKIVGRSLSISQIALLRQAGNDPAMQQVQDEMLTAGTSELARKLGLRLPLSISIISDSVVSLGPWATDIADTTERDMHGTPASGIDEKQWITAYMKNRSHLVANAYRSPRRFDRDKAYQALIDLGAWQEAGPGPAP